MSRLALIVLALASGLAAPGCGGDEPITPTAATPEESVEAAFRLFTGTLSPRGTAFYSFTVPQASGVWLTLASLTPTTDRVPTDARLTLGLGVPRGTGCAVTSSVTTAADLAAQVREWRAAGVHCAALTDPGVLTADVAFAVRIGYYR